MCWGLDTSVPRGQQLPSGTVAGSVTRETVSLPVWPGRSGFTELVGLLLLSKRRR